MKKWNGDFLFVFWVLDVMTTITIVFGLVTLNLNLAALS